MKVMTYLRICVSDFGMQWKDDIFCKMIMMNEMSFYFGYLISLLVLLFAICSLVDVFNNISIHTACSDQHQ